MKEIRCRIETAKKVFMEKKKLFTGKMNLELKKRIIKCSSAALVIHAEHVVHSAWILF